MSERAPEQVIADDRERATFSKLCVQVRSEAGRARHLNSSVRLRVESSERCVVVNDRVPLLPRLNGGEAKVVLLHLAWDISHWACRRSLARPICRKLKADEPQPGS